VTEDDVGLFWTLGKLSTELEETLLRKVLKGNHDTTGLIHRYHLGKPARKWDVAHC